MRVRTLHSAIKDRVGADMRIQSGQRTRTVRSIESTGFDYHR